MAVRQPFGLCQIHKLRFADVEEFPDDDKPDFSSTLATYATGRCKASVCAGDGSSYRTPVCSEDVEEIMELSDGARFFDDEGFFRDHDVTVASGIVATCAEQSLTP